jgi:hypothetical protein
MLLGKLTMYAQGEQGQDASQKVKLKEMMFKM